MTELQTKLMNWIAFNEMTPVNGAEPECAEDASCWLWTDEIANELNIGLSQTKGVIGSAVQAGLIWVCEDPIAAVISDDNSIGFTDKGFTAWKGA